MEDKEKLIELAVVLCDGTFDPVGKFTKEKADEFMKENPDCEFAWREVEDE